MEPVSLSDLSAFRPTGANWQIGGDALADLNRDQDLKALPGTGVLLNLPDQQNREHLFTTFEHGDLDLELDVMMARNSNSGIYLQGRYEVQLFDSWGKTHPAFSDMGGIYQRWDENKPEGEKGSEGHPPLRNVARAPGLWQHLEISFQAPRFDAGGKKIANARFIRVVLNGVIVQENVEVRGPTRAAAFTDEVALAPLMLQGDHGPVAFRNIQYRNFNGRPAALKDLKYRYFSGEHDYLPYFPGLKADASGEAEGLTWEYARGDNDFALQFNGTLLVPDSGVYRFSLSSNGNSMLQIAGDTVIGQAWWTRSATATLPAGSVPVEITYSKASDWLQPGLGLLVEGPAFRPVPLHLPGSVILSNPPAPILITPGNEPELLRSFIDIPQEGAQKRKRLTHPVSVGYPEGLSYTFDLDNGALVQIWKGGFLDATPMWNNRGDGHADPMGSVLLLGDAPQFAKAGSDWPEQQSDSAAYRFKGYFLDGSGNPTYKYALYGMDIEDKMQPMENGKWLNREICISGKSQSELRFRVARGKSIVPAGAGIWAVDDRAYYIRLSAQPELRNTPAGQELLLPVGQTIQYQLIW